MKAARIYSLFLLPPLGQYIVVLEEIEGTRLVPIWIGANEGNAIAIKLNNEIMPRPMTHDLIAAIFKSTNIEIEKIVISDLKNSTYYAELHLKTSQNVFVIDARPSDSLALAVRTNAPIFIKQEVFDKCPRIDKPITKKEIELFKEKIKNLKPEDFLQ